MAASLLNFRPQPYTRFATYNSNFIIPAKLQLESPTTKIKIISNCLHTAGSWSRTIPGGEIEDEGVNHKTVVKNWAEFVPGGNWWKIDEQDVTGKVIAAKPIAVLRVLRRMWALLADDRWVVFVAFGSLTIAALAEISMPNLLAASIFSAQNGETLVFYRKLNILILLCFVSGICSGLRSGCFGIANVVLLKRLREALYMTLTFQDISFFDQEAVGNLTSRIGADCQRLSHVIGNNLHLILRNSLQGVGALFNLLTLSWPLALSTCVICFVLSAIFLVYGKIQKGLLSSSLMARYQMKAAKVIQDVTARANEVSYETLSLVRTVRVYGTESKEQGRYKQWLDKLALISTRESAAYGLWNMSFSTLYRLTQSVGASEKVFQLMDLMPSDQFLSEGVKLQRLTGQFEFVNVSFNYPSRLEVATLENVNFSVQANESVAIVGPSGSGKSTLVYLLLGLYKPTDGQISVDDQPLQNLDIRWLRDNIGYVGQEPHLFRMDIKSNISYGCPRDIKQEDVEWAAKQAFAHEFISSLPMGYDTIVDDELLSGGQKQRIAIARAILRDPAILILDEATSAMDAESEYYIQGLLHGFKKDITRMRSIIFIAHRLSTAKAADKIIVMDGGRVVEMGKHSELLHQNGLYARLTKIQLD